MIKVLTIIPGTEEGPVMIFAKRQAASVIKVGVTNRNYFLGSRLSPFSLWKSYREARKLIKTYDPQLLHSQYGTVTAVFTMLLGKNYVITFHGSDINYTPNYGVLRDFFGRLFSNVAGLFAQRIFCVSPLMIEKVWWAKNKCVVMPVGVNTDEFKPVPKDAVRQKLGWRDNTFVVLFNAREPVIKRLDIARASIEELKKLTDYPVRLEELSGHVDADTIPDLINASDCILMCSDREGSPMIVKEAMACNKPVVTVDVGDAAERIRGVTGCYLVEREPAAIAQALLSVMTNGMEFETNGRQALIEQGLTEHEVAKKIADIYRDVAVKQD